MIPKYFLIRKKWRNYLKTYDEFINFSLRRGRPLMKFLSDIILEITEIVDNTNPINKELVLFRGLKPTDEFNPNDWELGQTITDLGFNSKSMSFQVASNFVGESSRRTPSCCILMVYYPVGSKQIYLNPGAGYSNLKYEYELLSYPGESFTVSDKFTLELSQYNLDRSATINYNFNVIVLDYVGNAYQTSNHIKNVILSRTNSNIDIIIKNNINTMIGPLNQLLVEDSFILSPFNKDQLLKYLSAPQKIDTTLDLYRLDYENLLRGGNVNWEFGDNFSQNPAFDELDDDRNEIVKLQKFFYLNNKIYAYALRGINKFIEMILPSINLISYSYNENDILITTSLQQEQDNINKLLLERRANVRALNQRLPDVFAHKFILNLRNGKIRQIIMNNEIISYPQLEEVSLESIGLSNWIV